MGLSRLCYLIMLIILISSCKFSCSAGGNSSEHKISSPEENNAIKGAVIKNDIDLEVTGVKLKNAYLADIDGNPMTENKARVGEKIYAIILLDTGWIKENDKSFIGASERISTSEGKVIVSADDIFKDYETTGVDATDAKFIKLSAVITEGSTATNDYVVNFRVWDKKGAGEVKGKYKFTISK